MIYKYIYKCGKFRIESKYMHQYNSWPLKSIVLLTASQDFAIHGPNKLLSKSHDHWKLSNWGFPALSSDPYFQTGFEIGFGNLSNRGSGFEIGFGNLSNRGSTWSHHLETSVKPLPKFPVAHQKWGGSLQKWPGCTQVCFGLVEQGLVLMIKLTK